MSKLTKLLREEKKVTYGFQRPNEKGHTEEATMKAPEAPLPSFDKSIEALTPVVQKVMEFKSVAGLTPFGISVSHTKHGTRSVVIHFNRTLQQTGRTYQDKTIAFRIDNPASDETGERECSAAEATLCIAAIDEALRYANGERSQQLLPLESQDAEPSGGSTESTESLFGDKQ